MVHGLRINITHDNNVNAYIVDCFIKVDDVEGGPTNEVMSRQYVSYLDVKTDCNVLTHVVRRQLQSLLCHELDEWLHRDGMRITDPHPKSGFTIKGQK